MVAAPDLAPAIDEDGLRHFVDTEYPKVVAAVALITGDRSRAEDAVQDAMVAAWQRTAPLENPAAWITVVATNRALSELRSRSAEKRAAKRLEQRLSTLPPAGTAEAAGNRITMQEAVEMLSVRQRQAVILHYYLDQTVEQSAVAMDVSPGTVKTTLHRARAALGQLVGLPGDDEGGRP